MQATVKARRRLQSTTDASIVADTKVLANYRGLLRISLPRVEFVNAFVDLVWKVEAVEPTGTRNTTKLLRHYGSGYFFPAVVTEYESASAIAQG